MTLKQLEAFYWAANCASFALAADRVHVSISSLSKRISELEQSLGVLLFDRNGQRATLTDAGELLLPRALTLLQDAEDMRSMVTRDAGLRGVCRLGVGELTAMTWLPRLVAYTRTHHPDLKLEPYVDAGSSMGSLEQKVYDGVLDLAIIAGRSTRAALLSDEVGMVRFKWVGAPAIIGDARTLTPELLQAAPIVTLPSGTGTTRVLEDWAALHGLTLDRRLTCNSWGAIAGLLIEGLGIGFLPANWADQLASRGDVRILQAADLAPMRYAFWARQGDNRAMIGALRKAVVATVNFDKPSRLL